MTARSESEIEYETEASRRRVSSLLDELKDRLSPGLIVDEVMGYGSEGSKEFVQTLGAQARRNPLACAIIGAGLAMLMMSEFRPPNSLTTVRRPHGGATDAGDVLGRTVDKADSAYDAARDAAGSAYGTAKETASSVYGSAKDAADSAYDATRDAYASATSQISDAAASSYDQAKRLGEKMTDKVVSLEGKAVDMARQGGHRIAEATANARTMTWDLLNDQPLVTAGIGLAVGAALGAMLPSTEVEDELMGGVSDDLKSQAKDIAEDQFEKVKSVATDEFEKVKSVAAEEFEKVKTVASEEFDKVKSVAAGEVDKMKSVAAGEFEKVKSAADEAFGATKDGVKQMAAEAMDTRGDAAESNEGENRDESVMSGIGGTKDGSSQNKSSGTPYQRQMK